MKKQSVSCLIIMMALAMMFCVPVYAEDEVYESKQTVYMDAFLKNNDLGFFTSAVDEMSDYTVSSSNSKVASIYVRKTSKKKDGDLADKYKFGVFTKFKKPGKATIKYSYNWGNGVSTTIIHYTVRKYTNPVSSLKIGGKEYKKKYNKNTGFPLKAKKISNKKVKIKLKKGWKLKSVVRYTLKGDSYQPVKLKNGFKKKLKKRDLIYFNLKNTKNKDETAIAITVT